MFVLIDTGKGKTPLFSVLRYTVGGGIQFNFPEIIIGNAEHFSKKRLQYRTMGDHNNTAACMNIYHFLYEPEGPLLHHLQSFHSFEV